MRKNTSSSKIRCKRRKLSVQGIILLMFLASISILALQSIMPKAVISNSHAADWEYVLLENQPNQQIVADDLPWYLTLVNRQNPIPANYEINLVEIANGEKVDERIYEPLLEMLTDAQESNWNQMPLIVSGYRTQKAQKQFYDDKIDEYRGQDYSESDATKMAQQWVAVPGYSEHQLGLAVDINGATYDLYLWLQANSYKYGFIFRYPGNKTEFTGTAEEVWHYRYVGVEAATQIYEQGLCLEEYLENLY